MAEENKVKISELTEATRSQIEGGFVPVAIPNQQTVKIPLSDFTDPPEIFVAIYGTTTNAQIAAAIADGKLVFANKAETGGACIAPLSEKLTGDIFHFIYAAPDGSREIWEVTSNGWTGDDLPTGIGGVFIDDTLTGSGTEEDPLGINTAEIEEIALGEAEDVVDAVRSKIVYTLDLGSITSGQTIQGSGSLFAKATLFNPNMDQPLNTTNSKIIFATNQTDGNVTSAYFALYRYDMLTNEIHWVANTDNFASMLATSGVHVAPITNVALDEEENPVQLKSNKMYYLVLISNMKGGKVVGNATSENLNSVPRVAFRVDNMDANNLSAATIQTKFPTLTPESEINSRLFAAITNVAVSDND